MRHIVSQLCWQYTFGGTTLSFHPRHLCTEDGRHRQGLDAHTPLTSGTKSMSDYCRPCSPDPALYHYMTLDSCEGRGMMDSVHIATVLSIPHSSMVAVALGTVCLQNKTSNHDISCTIVNVVCMLFQNKTPGQICLRKLNGIEILY